MMENRDKTNQWDKERFLECGLRIAIILLAIIPAIYLVSFLRFPYPLEYREPASLVAANAIHNGVNPFSLNSYPEDMYIYGLLYPFMIAPWINVIQPLVLIPRLIDFTFLILTVLLMFSFLRFRRATVTGSLIGASIFINALCLVFKINGSRPDLPALFFSLLGIYVIMKNGTAYRWLFLSALCGIGCLLLKGYLIIPLGLLVAHVFLFESKKKGIAFLGILIFLFAGSFLIIRFAFPLYLRYAILHPLYILSNDTGHMIMQVATFIQWYGILCLIYFCSILYKLRQGLKSGNRKWNLHLASLDKPLLEGVTVDFFDWGFVLIMAIMMISIAQNTGNSHTYFQELPLPFLILAVIPVLEQSIQHRLLKIIAYALCLSSLIPLSAGYQTKFDQYSKAYQLMESKMGQCQRIYGSPITDLYLLRRNMSPIYDNGLTEYGYTIIMSKNKIFQKLLGGNDGQLENKWNIWNRSLEDKVKNREFDCIVVDSQVRQIGNVVIVDYYVPETEILDVLDWDVIAYNIRIDITIWIPKESS
jgi:hypothetical protein